MSDRSRGGERRVRRRADRGWSSGRWRRPRVAPAPCCPAEGSCCDRGRSAFPPHSAPSGSAALPHRSARRARLAVTQAGQVVAVGGLDQGFAGREVPVQGSPPPPWRAHAGTHPLPARRTPLICDSTPTPTGPGGAFDHPTKVRVSRRWPRRASDWPLYCSASAERATSRPLRSSSSAVAALGALPGVRR